ncbi:hypothetical protein [Gymnodinialimonas sp.]
MQNTGSLINISSAIADFQHLELGLALTFIGWITVSWLLRKRETDG